MTGVSPTLYTLDGTALYNFDRLPPGIFVTIHNHFYNRNVVGNPHGSGRQWKSPEFECWYNMIARCYYRSSRCWNDYGGRGIRVCWRWVVGDGELSGFLCWLVDMGSRPEVGMTVDRIAVDKHYTTDNCRWATAGEQAKNKRRSKKRAA